MFLLNVFYSTFWWINYPILGEQSTMALHYMCGGCNARKTSLTFAALLCNCGHPHPMRLLCENCGDDFRLHTEYAEHIGQCNRCVACGMGGLNYTELVQHIAPWLFPNQNLRPMFGRIGRCYVLHDRNPFAATNWILIAYDPIKLRHLSFIQSILKWRYKHMLHWFVLFEVELK